MVTPDVKRKAVTHACEAHGVSQRWACKALNVDRAIVRHPSIRPDDDPVLVSANLYRVALHRARKADAERIRRKLQWVLPG